MNMNALPGRIAPNVSMGERRHALEQCEKQNQENA